MEGTEQHELGRIVTEPRIVTCFEAIDSQTSKQLEDQALANLSEADRAWLMEDVAGLIAPEEWCAFLRLEHDEEREQFVEQFWLRRSSNPDVPDNDFKTEHYRRIVFANDQFSTEIPGWKTDRGRVYVMFGGPDEIESHANGESTGRPPEEGPEAAQYSWQEWHFKYLEGLGKDIDLDFVDPGGSGDYLLAMSSEEKNSLLRPLTYKWVDWRDYDSVRSAPLSWGEPVDWIVSEAVPRVKFKDLEAMVVSQIIRDQMHFSYRIEYVRATHATTMARISVDIPEDELDETNGRGREEVEMFGMLSKLSGRVADTFERIGSFAELKGTRQTNPNWEVTIPLTPGPYQLTIVVKNLANEETGVMDTPMNVPIYEDLDIHK